MQQNAIMNLYTLNYNKCSMILNGSAWVFLNLKKPTTKCAKWCVMEHWKAILTAALKCNKCIVYVVQTLRYVLLSISIGSALLKKYFFENVFSFGSTLLVLLITWWVSYELLSLRDWVHRQFVVGSVLLNFLSLCIALCCVFLFSLSWYCVLLDQFCQCLWIVNSWLPHRFTYLLHSDDHQIHLNIYKNPRSHLHKFQDNIVYCHSAMNMPLNN